MSEHNEQKKHTLKEKWSNRRFRHGSIATAITAIVIVAVILLNMGASVLGKKVTLSFDLTKNQVFQLTETSIDYLKTLDKDVEIDVLAKDFRVAARTCDGIVEAIEHLSKPIYGVQFHPEMMSANDEKMLEIFKEFIEKA